MKYFVILLIFLSGCSLCSFEAQENHQLFPNPAIGDNLSTPKKGSSSTVPLVEKNDLFIEGREVEGIPTIMFGVKF